MQLQHRRNFVHQPTQTTLPRVQTATGHIFLQLLTEVHVHDALSDYNAVSDVVGGGGVTKRSFQFNRLSVLQASYVVRVPAVGRGRPSYSPALRA